MRHPSAKTQNTGQSAPTPAQQSLAGQKKQAHLIVKPKPSGRLTASVGKVTVNGMLAQCKCSGLFRL